MGNIQGFIFAQRKENFFICVVGFWIQFWLQHGFCEWPKEVNLYSTGYINGYLFISMCILTDLPQRKTLGHCQGKILLFLYVPAFPYTCGGSHTRGFSQGLGTPSSSCPREPTCRGTSPTTSSIKLIFHQNCLTMLHGSMIMNDSV